MLRVDLRAVDEAPVEIAGTVAVNDPVFEGVELDLRDPVNVAGRISSAGAGRYFWRGRIIARVAGECRRCLASVVTTIDAPIDVLFVEDTESEDPAVYLIPERAQSIDVREAVREELVLAVAPYVLCRDNCAGLCPQCGKELNTGACDCTPPVDPRWGALEALRGALPENEES